MGAKLTRYRSNVAKLFEYASPPEHRVGEEDADGKRILLLQEPVGPYFAKVQDFTNECGLYAWPITLNASDRMFANKYKTVDYGGREN